MKNLVIVLFLLSFSALSSELNEVRTEYLVSIDGVTHEVNNEEIRKVRINGKDVEISVSIGEFKKFNNYGISFDVPQKTSAYLDDSAEDYDIWNFDYQDSVMLLMVIKDKQVAITDKIVMHQIKRISKNMNMALSEFGDFSIKNGKVLGVSAIGNLGAYEFLVEEFGFDNDSFSFLAFYYSPLIERKTRNVDDVYQYFKSTIINTLKK